MPLSTHRETVYYTTFGLLTTVVLRKPFRVTDFPRLTSNFPGTKAADIDR